MDALCLIEWTRCIWITSFREYTLHMLAGAIPQIWPDGAIQSRVLRKTEPLFSLLRLSLPRFIFPEHLSPSFLPEDLLRHLHLPGRTSFPELSALAAPPNLQSLRELRRTSLKPTAPCRFWRVVRAAEVLYPYIDQTMHGL